ncbi:MAG: hypothetical protein WCO66_01060 [Candidatus Absconditabacteria bacterium]
MDKEELELEKLELLGWLIVKGKSQEDFNVLLGKHQEYCKLSTKAVNALPKEEFANHKKQPYLTMIMEYTNHKEDGKFKRQKEDLAVQNFNVEHFTVLLLINGFFSKWIFTYFKGFANMIQEIAEDRPIPFSEENTKILFAALKKPVLSDEVKQLFLLDPEELAQKITEGNGVRSKIVSALKEDYWIHLGKYWEPFEIKKGNYLISNSDFEFLFEVNQIILKKVFQKKEIISDLSKELIFLCSRLSKGQQLEMLESLEDACHARTNVCIDSGKTKIRFLANKSDYIEVLAQIRFKFPEMKISF